MLAVGAIVTTAAALQAATGIGFAVLGAPLLAIVRPELVPGPILLLSVFLTAMTLAREFHAIDLSGLSVAIAGRIAGTAAAGVALALLPAAAFAPIFSLMILTAVALSLARWQLLPTRINLITAGLLSGLMGTITSVGAPPMALVYQNMPGPRVRATMGAFLLIGASFSLATLALIGRFTAAHALSSLWMTAPVLLGFLLSQRFLSHVDRKGVKPFVLGVSAIAALVSLLRALL